MAAPAVHEPRGREEEEARQVRGAAAVGLALLHSLLGFGWQRQLGGLPLAAARRADASARLREPAAGQQQPEPEVAHCYLRSWMGKLLALSQSVRLALGRQPVCPPGADKIEHWKSREAAM